MTESDRSLSKYVRFVLDGLAQAWADATGHAKPSDGLLIESLPESDETNRLALAGYAYGVAKKLSAEYPGAAILLLGAALDSIGSAPRSDLREKVRRVRRILKDASLTKDSDVVEVLDAAQALSNFDKVTQKMVSEFSQGLRDSGDYPEPKIKDLAKEIVEVTHAARHKALIQRFFIAKRQTPRASRAISFWDAPETQSSSDASFMYEAEDYEVVEDRLASLVEPALIACAHQISRRLRNRMNEEPGQ